MRFLCIIHKIHSFENVLYSNNKKKISYVMYSYFENKKIPNAVGFTRPEKKYFS